MSEGYCDQIMAVNFFFIKIEQNRTRFQECIVQYVNKSFGGTAAES